MNIKQNLVKKENYNIKCPYEMDAEFIVVHNTANDASAKNEVNYMIGNKNKVSFHYAVDHEEIVQGIPENRNAWHAGDSANGQGNRKGIAIEICYSRSGGDRFINAEKLASEFIAMKLKEKGWGIDKVKKHQDFANKNCPHRTLELGWDRFLNMIKAHLEVPQETPFNSYTVKVTADVLNVRAGAGTNYKVNTTIKKGEVYTIVEEDNGWGKLKSGAGWIKLSYTTANKASTKPAHTYLSNPNYKGASLVDALNQIGVDSSFNYRKKLAVKNNILNYTGRSDENKRLLDRLKAGKLIKA